MGFKNVSNSGMSDADLARGYSDTGVIPEEGSDLMNAQADADKEAREDKKERAMAKEMGWPVEDDFGGFLERNDCDSRL